MTNFILKFLLIILISSINLFDVSLAINLGSLFSRAEVSGQLAKQYSFTQGNVFGGWAWIKGFHDRNDDDGNMFTTTFTSGFIIEDLWGENILKIEREWQDWGGVDHKLLDSIPNGGTAWVDIGCHEKWCGPMVSDTNFEPVVKVGMASWTDKLIIRINGHEVNLNNLADNAWHKTSPKTYTYNYKPDFSMSCKNIKKLERKETHLILAVAGNVKSNMEVTIKESSTLTSESSTSAEWFLEAAVNSGNKIGLEIPVEGAKLGVEQTLGWSVKGSTKYTTTDKSSTSLNYERQEKKSLEHACNNDDNLYQVTQHDCIEFDLKNCKASGVVERYEGYKFDDTLMRTCHTNQFTACAKNENDLKEKLKLAMGGNRNIMNNALAKNSLGSHRVMSSNGNSGHTHLFAVATMKGSSSNKNSISNSFNIA